MEVFGIGLPELLMILLIALLVVGPQRLPEVAVQIARFVREFRAYTANMTRDLTEALEELQREAESAKGEITSVTSDVTSVKEEWREIGQGLRSTTAEINESLRGKVPGSGSPAAPAPPALPPPPENVQADGHSSTDHPVGGAPAQG